MKTERRHELQTNELGIWLVEFFESIKPYATTILGVIVAALVVVGIYRFTTAQRESRAMSASDALSKALQTRSIDDKAGFMGQQVRVNDTMQALKKVSEEYAGTPSGLWAVAHLARMQVHVGCEQLFADRKEATVQLGLAVDNFTKVEKLTSDPDLLEFASYWLAVAYEAQFELDKARDQYDKVFRRWPEGLYAKRAEENLARLKRPSEGDWYDWFAEQKPQAVTAGDPGFPGLMPPSTPHDFPSSSNDDPHNIPAELGKALLNTGEPKSEETAPDTEKTPEAEKSPDAEKAQEEAKAAEGDKAASGEPATK